MATRPVTAPRPRRGTPFVPPRGFHPHMQAQCGACGSWKFRGGPMTGMCPVCRRFSRATMQETTTKPPQSRSSQAIGYNGSPST
eukprot:7045651-Pyramimonas_sp.AAC.1